MSRALIWVTDDEILLLDGRASPENQAKVDVIKTARATMAATPGMSSGDAAFLARVVAEAKLSGRLIGRYASISGCSICDKDAPDQTRGRNGRQLRVPRRTYMQGREMAHRFVTMTGRVELGGCNECVTRLVPEMRARLAGVAAEMPEWLTGEAPKWKRCDNKKCTRCGWTGHELEMGRERTFFGDGWYPAVCPSCGIGNTLGSHPVETVDGFAVVSADLTAPLGRDVKARVEASRLGATS